MAYQALVLQLLISCPSDVPEDHLATINRTVIQWNISYGKLLGVAIAPTSWSQHAVSVFGKRPQHALNDQLVNEADIVLALFSDRLGTPTGEAESGTVEEIEVAVAAGKHVSILLNDCPRTPSSKLDAAEEKVRLSSWLKSNLQRALTMSYSDTSELVQHVNNLLSSQAASVGQQVKDAKESGPKAVLSDPSKKVWPRVEVKESPKTDSRGRLTTDRRWYLVLENATGEPVTNVRYEVHHDGSGVMRVIDRSGPIATMAPGTTFSYPMVVSMGTPDQMECTVSWTSASGGDDSVTATVRI